MTNPRMMDPDEASQLIEACLPKTRSEYVRIEEALHRILGEDLYAQSAQPHFSRVCMDGIAIQRQTENGRWRHQALQLAGEVPLAFISDDHAIEIATGAVSPLGCQRIIPYEELTRQGDFWTLKEGLSLAGATHIQEKGAELQAGELLLAQGSPLRAPEICLLAAQGITSLAVRKKPRVAIVSNGSELVPPSQSPLAHQLRDSNSSAIKALLQSYGYPTSSLHLVPDDPQRMQRALGEALETCDVLIISAGVSRGPRDLVPEVLKGLGVDVRIHGVHQRPGKPFFFGMLGDQRGVFGLPGNPVAALMNAARYVLPYLYGCEGRAFRVPERRLGEAVGEQARATMFPVRYEAGELLVKRSPLKGSGDFVGLRGTDGFVMIPPARRCEVGDRVAFLPWSLEALL